jgi:hypothetical protein
MTLSDERRSGERRPGAGFVRPEPRTRRRPVPPYETQNLIPALNPDEIQTENLC